MKRRRDSHLTPPLSPAGRGEIARAAGLTLLLVLALFLAAWIPEEESNWEDRPGGYPAPSEATPYAVSPTAPLREISPTGETPYPPPSATAKPARKPKATQPAVATLTEISSQPTVAYETPAVTATVKPTEVPPPTKAPSPTYAPTPTPQPSVAYGSF